MTPEEYKQLIDMVLKMRILEGMLAESLEEVKRLNSTLRELTLRERK